jgi:hypothetical protein
MGKKPCPFLLRTPPSRFGKLRNTLVRRIAGIEKNQRQLLTILVTSRRVIKDSIRIPAVLFNLLNLKGFLPMLNSKVEAGRYRIFHEPSLLLVGGTRDLGRGSGFPGSVTEPVQSRTGINWNCRKGKRESGPSLPYPRQPNLSCLYVLVCTDIFCHFRWSWMSVSSLHLFTVFTQGTYLSVV